MNQKIRTLSGYIAILLDIIIILVAYSAANVLRFNTVQVHEMTSADYVALRWFIILAYIAVQLFFRTNTDFLARDKLREAYLVLKQYIIVSACVMTYFYLMKLGGEYSRLQLGYFFVIALTGTYIEHLVLKKVLQQKYRTTYAEKIVLISDSHNAGKVLEELRKIAYLSTEYIALVDKDMTGQDIGGVPVIADMDNMEDIIKNIPVDGAFIYIPYKAREVTEKIMGWLNAMGIKIYLDLQEYGYEYGQKQFTTIGNYGVMVYSNYEYGIRDIVIKRIMDICGGAVLFICMCIALPFVAIGIAVQSPGPIMFKQIRIGKNGRRFEIYKFRSMYMDSNTVTRPCTV